MKPIKSITFDKKAQENLPEHIKAKMKANQENAMVEQVKKQNDMKWKDKIGKYAWRVKDSSVVKSRIDEGRISFHLNIGSERHGRLLDPKIEYRFYQEKEWVKIENIFFTKDDFLSAL